MIKILIYNIDKIKDNIDIYIIDIYNLYKKNKEPYNNLKVFNPYLI